MSELKERLQKFIETIGYTPARFQKEAGLSNGFIDKVGDNLRPDTLNKILDKFPNINRVWLVTGEGNMLRNEASVNQTETLPYIETRRSQKIQTNEETDGIIYVPISAQAGYAKKIVDPMFRTSLQKLFIPGMPYRGERYRLFEVEGNSMEPTFKEHFHVVTEKVDQEFWGRPKDYYAYVLVTDEEVLLKRVYRKNDRQWILISDNDLYPQFLFDVSTLKELWLVKRRMDWEMAPPKRFVVDDELMK